MFLSAVAQPEPKHKLTGARDLPLRRGGRHSAQVKNRDAGIKYMKDAGDRGVLQENAQGESYPRDLREDVVGEGGCHPDGQREGAHRG